MAYKAENLHALSHGQYFWKNVVLDIRYCAIESKETLILNLKGYTFWVSNEARCNCKNVVLHEMRLIHCHIDIDGQESICSCKRAFGQESICSCTSFISSTM